jgi:hypothetical protein
MRHSRLLFLIPRRPYPLLSGGKLFLLHVARALQNLKLTLLSLCGTHEEMEFEPDEGIFAAVCKINIPNSLSRERFLRTIYYESHVELCRNAFLSAPCAPEGI